MSPLPPVPDKPDLVGMLIYSPPAANLNQTLSPHGWVCCAHCSSALIQSGLYVLPLLHPTHTHPICEKGTPSQGNGAIMGFNTGLTFGWTLPLDLPRDVLPMVHQQDLVVTSFQPY